MSDDIKTNAQLLEEIAELRQRISELEGTVLAHQHLEEKLRMSEERYRLLA